MLVIEIFPEEVRSEVSAKKGSEVRIWRKIKTNRSVWNFQRPYGYQFLGSFIDITENENPPPSGSCLTNPRSEKIQPVVLETLDFGKWLSTSLTARFAISAHNKRMQRAKRMKVAQYNLRLKSVQLAS